MAAFVLAVLAAAGPARGQPPAEPEPVRKVIASSRPAPAPDDVPKLPAPVEQAVYHPAPAPAVSGASGSAAPRGRGAQVSVEASGPPAAAPDEPARFEIVVRCTGAVAAAGVRVEAALPPGARLLQSTPAADVHGDRLAWALGNLDPGGERRIRLELQAGGLDDLTLRPGVTFASAAAARARVARPPFAVAQLGPDAVERGAKETFRIQVSNNGPGVVRHVLLRDRLPPGLQHPQGGVVEADIDALQPGETRTLPLEVTAVEAGEFVNAVEAVAEGGLHAEAKRPVRVDDVRLGLKLDLPRRAAAGRDLDVRLEAANPGAHPAAGVRLTLSLPDGLDFVSAAGGAYDPAARRVVWATGALEKGQTQVATAKLRGRATGEWTCQATAAAERLGEARASQPVRVEGAPALRVEFAPAGEAVAAGVESVVELRVSNQGDGPATNVRLTAVAPDVLTPLSVEGPAPGRVAGRQASFDLLPALAPRQTVVYRVKVRGGSRGEGRWQADLNADQLPQPVQAEAPARVAAGGPAPSGG
jgi:uncharacterized repeat protein (TIGR01451 family)